MKTESAVWSTKYKNDLPDSAFMHIEPGGKKDSEGKTVPRSLRHFPYKDANGKIDIIHVRNAIARIPQAKIPAALKVKLQKKARAILAKLRKSKADIIILLNSIAKEDEPEPSLNEIDSTIQTRDILGGVALVAAISAALLAIFGEAAADYIKKKLDSIPKDCLSYFNDPLVQQILTELRHLFDILGQLGPTPDDFNIYNILHNTSVTFDEPQQLIANSIDDLLKRLKGLISDLSLGKCGKVWGDILAGLLVKGFPKWAGDLIQKAIQGLIDASAAVGAILHKVNPQWAAQWAAQSVMGSYQVQTQVTTPSSIDWGSVAIALGIAGAVVLTVYTGGIAAGVLVAALGTAGTAMADAPPQEIQSEIEERIKLQEEILNSVGG